MVGSVSHHAGRPSQARQGGISSVHRRALVIGVLWQASPVRTFLNALAFIE